MRQPRDRRSVRPAAHLARWTLATIVPLALLAGCPAHRDETPAPDHAAVRLDAASPDVPTPAPDASPARPVHAAAVVDAGAPDVTPVVAGHGQAFLDGDDDRTLAWLCNEPVSRVVRNTGGSTVSFRAWMGEGHRGLFKPQQRADVANFRAELAAYRLSRRLGLGRVPPACGRVLERARLQTAADATGDPVFSERVLHELLGREETVPGAMLYWVPGPLEPVPGTERSAELLDASRPLAPEDTELAADLARLIVFDFVTDNVDRWSGGNILRQHPRNHDPGPMLFMDNGASFSALNDGLGARPRAQAERLARIGRFPRALTAQLRALTYATLAGAMGRDPLAPLLSEAQLRAVLTRRDRVIQHIDELVATHGADAVLVFP